MNITFFIGNGFDINLGLKTRYIDFYQYFIDKSNKANMIHSWLEEDEKSSEGHFENWSDLELALGENLKNINSEEQKNQFYDDKAELADLLLEYLEKEQKKFSVKKDSDGILQEFQRSLKNFYTGLPKSQKERVETTLSKYSNGPYKYCFINFNYTNTLDRIVEAFKKSKYNLGTHESNRGKILDSIGEIVHIHGTITEEMILGINDATQINNPMLREDQEFLDVMVKERINARLEQMKAEHVKEIINGSHIMCIFGMSLGDTDKMWWKELFDWLGESEDNILIIFYIVDENQLKRRISDNIIRLRDDFKKEFLKKGGVTRENQQCPESNRIYFLFNSDLFNFKMYEIVNTF